MKVLMWSNPLLKYPLILHSLQLLLNVTRLSDISLSLFSIATWCVSNNELNQDWRRLVTQVVFPLALPGMASAPSATLLVAESEPVPLTTPPCPP